MIVIPRDAVVYIVYIKLCIETSQCVGIVKIFRNMDFAVPKSSVCGRGYFKVNNFDGFY